MLSRLDYSIIIGASNKENKLGVQRKHMRGRNVLITGGAGFIGSHLAERLFEIGYKVKILDNLSPQIHGPDAKLPQHLKDKVEFIKGDVRSKVDLKRALTSINAVVHLAAETGVGQSMYEIARYVNTNVEGSAILLECVIEKSQVSKIILASSRAVYGEGKYICEKCGITYPESRSQSELKRGRWHMHCAKCGRIVEPLPTDENTILRPMSIYAVTKQAQEQMFSIMAKAHKIPYSILRYFNVYGQRQSLSNPYTGILSIFSSRIVNGKPPLVYEDGLESRDFVHVSEVIKATILALEKTEANYEIFNVGSGRRATILEVANLLADKLGGSLRPIVVGKYREGDIRHCYADLSKIKTKLGYEPSKSLEEGISEFVEWVKHQKNILDLSDKASKELARRKLLREM
ncbi:MAG: SDR family NAD(P)-dependent oxidoreductase [Methanotrichaceae archaeon]|nr:SDR family NAD(P)-dependent oxidoreductase [Methanotrichaceae archaeon]